MSEIIEITFQKRSYVIIKFNGVETRLEYTMPGGTMFMLPPPPRVVGHTFKPGKREQYDEISDEVLDVALRLDDLQERERLIFCEVYKTAIKITAEIQKEHPDYTIEDYAKSQLRIEPQTKETKL